MAEHKVVVYVVVGLLGVAAAALAFAAEATKIKVSDIVVTTYGCEYPSTSANILGYVAAVLTLVAQIIISSVARCGCCKGTNNNSTGAIIFFVFSWVSSIIGIGLLVTAARLSSREEYLEDWGYCYTVKPGVFAAGGGLALLATILGLFAYSSSSKFSPQQAPLDIQQQQGGIAMGQPHYYMTSSNTYPPKQQQYV